MCKQIVKLRPSAFDSDVAKLYTEDMHVNINHAIAHLGAKTDTRLSRLESRQEELISMVAKVMDRIDKTYKK